MTAGPLPLPATLEASLDPAMEPHDIGAALDREMTPGERLFFRTADMALGWYRGKPCDAWFRGSGPLALHYFGIPLQAVEIHHQDKRPFLASPATLSMFAPGDVYTRRAVDPAGDRAIYLAVAGRAMLGYCAGVAPALADRSRAAALLSGPARLLPVDLLAARSLVAALSSGQVASTFEAEERTSTLLARLARSAAEQLVRLAPERVGVRRTDQLRRVEAAKEFLAVCFDRTVSLDAVGRAVGVPPARLARWFRAQTGMTLHDYLTTLRLARSLDLIRERPRDIAGVALDLGFTHHSHFSARFKRCFGTTPSAFAAAATGVSVAPRRRALGRPRLRPQPSAQTQA